jgi:DNA-binding SARP family transcriptional activator
MQTSFLVRVLGPIDVVTPSGSRSVGGRQTRALLGALVIGAGHAVPADHLREVLWGELAPDSADNTLQSYVSHLRQLLGPDTIKHVDHSYELTADADNIDALRFESLLAQASESKGDPESCLAHCREALHLWRGRPFGELADDESFKLETYRLEELRLVTMELSIEAELALGHHELVVGELQAAVQEHPYREQVWILLIEALAGSQRRVEALRECARLRHVLADVGVQASDELVSLEQRILQGHGTPQSSHD